MKAMHGTCIANRIMGIKGFWGFMGGVVKTHHTDAIPNDFAVVEIFVIEFSGESV